MKTMRDLRDSIVRKLEAEGLKLSARIAGGSAGDFAEYKNMTGRIKGLSDAIDVVNEVFNKLLDEENDE
jgi:hypothetical protein